MKIFYHGDMDGIVSAHILWNGIVPYGSATHMKNLDEVFVEFDYNKQQDLESLEIAVNETIYFVDCSPSEELLINWAKRAKSIFIIDHHVSRKEMLEKLFEEKKINGMFYDGASASLITYCWQEMVVKKGNTVQEVKDFLDWFKLSKANQEKSNVPLAIRLVNSWDIWNGLYIDAEPYKIVFESKHFVPYNKEINSFLYDTKTITETIKKGYIMKEQMDTWAETFMNRYGYETEFEGHKFFVANLGNGNSKYFGDKIKDYDAVIPYCYNGDLWTFSIYSDKEKEFDCAEFATRFGGGGYKKAAGFRTDTIPEWITRKK